MAINDFFSPEIMVKATDSDPLAYALGRLLSKKKLSG